MAGKAIKEKSLADMVVNSFAGTVAPGGPSSSAFQRVINALRGVIGETDKKTKKKQKSAADILFGK
jgi:hypothetical protein